MSLYLSSTSIMKPSLPTWLEDICQRLADNDPSLISVELTHPRIDDVGARVFAKALEDNSMLQTLILSFYGIVDDGAYAIGRVLGDVSNSASQSIRKLQFRELRVSRDFVTLFESLKTNTVLEELSLRYSQVCLNGSIAFEKVLAANSKLKEVRIVDTRLSLGALEHICEGITASSSIQRLYLINTELEHSDAHFIANMLQDIRCSLRELHLAENNFGDKGVGIIMGGLQGNASLRLLDLRSNGITENGALAIQGLLVSSKHLLCLGLGSNELGSLGATAISRGVTHVDCVLESLDLSDNDISEVGACAISHMLRYNVRLLKLNLSLNHLGDVGTTELSNGIARNRTLKWISLRRNGITNKGAHAVAKQLPRMHGLKELILARNTIGYKGAEQLLEGLRSNFELEYLHLEDGRSASSMPIHKEIKHWIRLNKAGRRIFKQTNVAPPVWPKVYSRLTSDSDLLYHFLLEKPDALKHHFSVDSDQRKGATV